MELWYLSKVRRRFSYIRIAKSKGISCQSSTSHVESTRTMFDFAESNPPSLPAKSQGQQRNTGRASLVRSVRPTPAD
eukprot:3360834-Rhodomonas_salina.1